jgi:SAM-dependent methyltransferase
MSSDKRTELKSHDRQAQSLLTTTGIPKEASALGSSAILPIYRAPYTYYEHCIIRYILRTHDVLEIGSGNGVHTYALKQTGARVVTSDISMHQLALLCQRIKGVKALLADMEVLPFDEKSFDVVVSAGSLSYGDPMLVDAEIKRVLRPGGIFLCVDSLNHNPVYRLNRWIHYKRGERTKSTLLFMPTMRRIQSISKGFERIDVRYFGTISYLMTILARFIGQYRAAEFSDYIDQLVHVRRTAFKFVLVARGRF